MAPFVDLHLPRPRDPDPGGRSSWPSGAKRASSRLSNLHTVTQGTYRLGFENSILLAAHHLGRAGDPRPDPRLRDPDLAQRHAAATRRDRLRRARQLRRHQPHLHLHRHAGLDRRPHGVAERTSTSTRGTSGSTSTRSSASSIVYMLLPDPAHGARDHPGARRACAPRGGRRRRTWVPRASATGAPSASRSCSPRCSGGCCCCSAAALPPTPRPTP